MSANAREILKEATLTREMVDRFLDPHALNWATFDPILGYRHRDCVCKDGIDGSYTTLRYGRGGERLMIHYADQACRISTYGNSFTHCDQVSDGETWQEYLAAHLGEPIRNFGTGGYGVYQAYRRMRREEKAGPGAEYVMLNVWSDDHLRSLYPFRWIEIKHYRRGFNRVPHMFHSNPWAHLYFNPQTGLFEERENPYPTPASLYKLCDADYVYETFKDCFDVQVFLAQEHAADVNLKVLQAAADALHRAIDNRSPETLAASAQALFLDCALRSSMAVVEKARQFAEDEHKKLMVLLSYSNQDVIRACRGEPRFDQPFVDYLDDHHFLYADALKSHQDDYKSFNGTPEAYADRYYIGHYNPKGNHFFAFAIKDALVAWLDPKPPAYDEKGPSIRDQAALLA
jgi:hypothetical protein